MLRWRYDINYNSYAQRYDHPNLISIKIDGSTEMPYLIPQRREWGLYVYPSLPQDENAIDNAHPSQNAKITHTILTSALPSTLF